MPEQFQSSLYVYGASLKAEVEFAKFRKHKKSRNVTSAKNLLKNVCVCVCVCVCMSARVLTVFIYLFIYFLFLSVWVLLPFDGEIKMYIMYVFMQLRNYSQGLKTLFRALLAVSRVPFALPPRCGQLDLISITLMHYLLGVPTCGSLSTARVD